MKRHLHIVALLAVGGVLVPATRAGQERTYHIATGTTVVNTLRQVSEQHHAVIAAEVTDITPLGRTVPSGTRTESELLTEAGKAFGATA